MRVAFLAAMTLGSAFACGCGGASPPPDVPPSSTVDAGVPTVEAPKPANKTVLKFHDLPRAQKVEIMSSKVVPDIGNAFKEYDATRYATFGCATCHGPTKKADPHDVLPKLTLTNGGFERLSKEKPEVVKFMAGRVEPMMGSILGEDPYDPVTHKGFGCNGCHSVN